MKVPSLRSGLSRAPVGGTFALALAMFVVAIAAVYSGFTAYYSRVNLSAELEKDHKNIDVLFMQINRVESDTAEFERLQHDLSDARESGAPELAKLLGEAYASKEYQDYIQLSGIALSVLTEAQAELDDRYWEEIVDINYQYPSLRQAADLGNPKFKPSASADARSKIYDKLLPTVQGLRVTIVKFDGKFGNRINVLRSQQGNKIRPILSAISAIESRNPEWRTRRDAKTGIQVASAKDQAIEKQRAIIRSYRNALGWGSAILQWPTIVSTLMVTIAAGWLGGIVSFLGVAIRSEGSARREAIEFDEPQIVSLLRRSVLSVTAALGIFLFAGSGLLVLTAQAGKLATQGSIELNPFFVAFLAFISGFLADDAFVRLIKAGRALFRTEGGDSQPQPPSPPGEPEALPPQPA